MDDVPGPSILSIRMPLCRTTPIVFWGACLLALFQPPALAAAPETAPAPTRRFRVATRLIPPFVVQEDDQLIGFSIELWRSIATRLGVERADAVVYDSPILLHYAANEGKGKVEVVGSVFRQESYGILLPSHSPYRKPINEALLRLREDGTYQQIFERWFGAR